MIDGIQIARLGGFVQRVSFGVERRRAGIVRLRFVDGNGEQSGGKRERREESGESDEGGDGNGGSPAVVLV